jgi:opacity protein-like surface antigen
LGVGYRHQFDNNWFFQGEYKVVQYKRNSRLDTKPSSKGLVLGLGYQF